MMLILHIVIALSSLVYTTYLMFKPSRTGLNASYGFVLLTLVTGTFLVVQNSAHMLQACMSGLVYLACSFVGIFVANYRLARARQNAND